VKQELYGLEQSRTYPPLNAPTGFRTGNCTASASLWEEVKFRITDGEERLRIAGLRRREYIVVCSSRQVLGDDHLRLNSDVVIK
jgi:hypothetical protein